MRLRCFFSLHKKSSFAFNANFVVQTRRSLASSSSSSSWNFPKPPPPPTPDEVSLHGIPLLQQAFHHAQNQRIFLSEWPADRQQIEEVSYDTVLRRAATVASFLMKKSNESQRSTRFVAHLTIPGSEYITCQWGAFGAGFASVPLATSHKVRELEYVLHDSDPQVILLGQNPHTPANEQELFEAAKNLGMTDRIVNLQECYNSAHSYDKETYWLGSNRCLPSGLDTPALLMYTSGTTGKPKGVLSTHRNLYHQITDLVSAWEWKNSDVALHVLPLHHVHGVVNVLSCAAYSGARLEFQPFHAETLWNQWAQSSSSSAQQKSQKLPKPTVFMAVPTIYAKLLEAATKLPSTLVETAVTNTLQPMRLMVSGSAALPVSVMKAWEELTGHVLLERYGMTEFAMALSNPYNPVSSRQAGHVGLPLPSVNVRLVDETTGVNLITTEEQGKKQSYETTQGALQVKGSTVFKEYLNRPEATAEAFTEDGYFQTGDIAEWNNELHSWRILGRASVDIIKTGGFKVSALEIERELLEHPDIAEVVIIGIPGDVIWGDRVGMIGRRKERQNIPCPSLEEIRAWCEPRMAKYKLPTKLLWVDDIPKNAMGKVNKKELVKLFDNMT